MKTMAEQYGRALLTAFITCVFFSFLFVTGVNKKGLLTTLTLYKFPLKANKTITNDDFKISGYQARKYEQFFGYSPIALDSKYCDVVNATVVDDYGCTIDDSLTIIHIPASVYSTDINKFNFARFVVLSSDYDYPTPIDLHYRIVSVKAHDNLSGGAHINDNFFIVKYWVTAKKKNSNFSNQQYLKYVAYFYFQVH